MTVMKELVMIARREWKYLITFSALAGGGLYLVAAKPATYLPGFNKSEAANAPSVDAHMKK